MSDRSEEEERKLQRAINALRARTFENARPGPGKKGPVAAAGKQAAEGSGARDLARTVQPSSPALGCFSAIRAQTGPVKSSPPGTSSASFPSLVPPVEEWDADDHELARLALAALGFKTESSPSSPQRVTDARILETMPDVDGEELARLFLAAWGKEVKDPPGTLPSPDDPDRPETEEEAISAEAIRRSRVRQGIRRGQSRGPPPSTDSTPAARASAAGDQPDTPQMQGPDPRETSLLRDPSEISAGEIALWDALALSADMPDAQSCASAWQLSGLARSRRAGASIVLRQTDDSQAAFAVTKAFRGYRLGPLEAHWHFGSPLIGPGSADLLADIIRQLRTDPKAETIEIVVSGLDPAGALARQVRKGFAGALWHRQDPLAAASLEGGIDGWLSRRSSNFRRNLRRAQRRAQEAGICFERAQPSSEADADQCYARMLAVEKKSWKGPGRHGLLALQAFYQTLLRAYAERGAARVVFAKRADEDAGFCYGGASHGIYRGQQTSYRDDLAGFSIGTLMHFETAKWLAEDGARLQHFGPVQRMMSYKCSLCEIELPSVLSVIRV
jgi:CelD/BcsL family acetyltransferase involved in cellulose biosynthesis